MLIDAKQQRALASACALVLAGIAGPARADQDPNAESNTEAVADAGIKSAAALSSIVYAPVKVAYAAGGSIVAGLAWVVSGGDAEVAKPILDASTRGDYVITPEQIKGERSIEFVGRPASDAGIQASQEASKDPAVSSGGSWK